MFLVPRATRNDLMGKVAELNTPLTPANRGTHPLSLTLRDLKAFPRVVGWAGQVGANINLVVGGAEERTVVEKRAFDNAYIAAFGLIRVGYEKAGREMPVDDILPEGHMFVASETTGELGGLFEALNARQRMLAEDYPELLEAVQAYAYERMPGHGQGRTVGAVAIGAAEMYYAFEDLESRRPSQE